jgi:hypothetical protein
MAAIDTNWPTRPVYQYEGDWLQYDTNGQHFLANRYSASPRLQQQGSHLHDTESPAIDIPVSPRSPIYTSYASKKALPLLSPAPAWHQLRVPAWLEAHDQVSSPQQELAPSNNPRQDQQKSNYIEAEQALQHQPQRQIFHDWLTEQEPKQIERSIRKVVLTDTKRRARAQRIAEAKVRNREKRERWRALARKVEEGDEDLVMED